jgi:hypothetical protein
LRVDISSFLEPSFKHLPADEKKLQSHYTICFFHRQSLFKFEVATSTDIRFRFQLTNLNNP